MCYHYHSSFSKFYYDYLLPLTDSLSKWLSLIFFHIPSTESVLNKYLQSDEREKLVRMGDSMMKPATAVITSHMEIFLHELLFKKKNSQRSFSQITFSSYPLAQDGDKCSVQNGLTVIMCGKYCVIQS